MDRLPTLEQFTAEQVNEVADVALKTFQDRLIEKYGLRTLFLSTRGDDTIKIDMIEVEKDERKQGIGSKVMEEITDYADKHGLRIILTTGLQDSRRGTTSASRLKKFYKRFGFVENKGRNKDFTISENMYRDPK